MQSKLYFGVGGLLIGFASGILAIGSILSKKYKDKIEELEVQNEDLLDQLHKARKANNAKKKQKTNDILEDDSDPFEVEDLDKTHPIGSKHSEEKVYNTLIERYSISEDDEEEIHVTDSQHPTDSHEDVDEFGVRRMTSKDYHQDLEFRDSEMLTYYQQDGVLCDAVNDVLFHEETYIGSDIMNIIDDTDEDYLYCENVNDDKIYEITVEHNLSYFRDVVGSGLEEDD